MKYHIRAVASADFSEPVEVDGSEERVDRVDVAHEKGLGPPRVERPDCNACHEWATGDATLGVIEGPVPLDTGGCAGLEWRPAGGGL